jgi:2-polyprenyl-6-methoxyphenol hydroxylase-like FAD-dependent oxidoreductase
MQPERVIIAGAGIGGMALAAALQRLGIPLLVLERAPRLGEVGAGLAVQPNAVHALAAIGVSRQLFRDAGPFRCFRICSQSGAELAEVAEWPFGLPELFARTPSAQILQNDIFDRDPANRQRAVLLGDAAHPTTPNLGQGACLAIEDAVVLARSIARHPDCESAFSHYYRRRARRTTRITRLSRWWGKVGLWKARPLVRMRDGAYRAAPRAWLEWGMRDQYDYDVGALE